ncbi:MAG: haloacid dehalogenase type II [Rhodoferax sp.]
MEYSPPPTPSAPGAPAPRAVLFDAYGTLFDVHSVAALAERLFPGQGQALSTLWRDKQIEYTRLVGACNGGAHYRPFAELTRYALRFAIKKIASSAYSTRADADFGPQEQQLMDQYRRLDAFPENREVLQALRAAGVPTGILSNGDPPMLHQALQSSGLEPLLDVVLSADAVRSYKTHPQVYALGPQALGLDAAEILFVSSNAWDALGATWFGYQTLWVNRSGQPFEELGTPPTHQGSSLRAVLDCFPV